MVGAYAGARLSVHVSGAAQLTLFAVVMIVAAYFMLRGRAPGAGANHREAHLERGERVPVALIALEGIAVGLLTGLVGVGGGFLIVPALVLLVRLPMKQAVGTSLVVIAMNGMTGFLGYIGRVEVDWGLMAVFTAVAMVGIMLGTQLVRRVPQQALRRIFAVFLLLVGAAILYENRSTLVPGAEAKVHAAEALLR